MSKAFHEINPESLLATGSLDPDEKRKILQEWEQDEVALLRAVDENMKGDSGSGEAGDILRRIKSAERVLKDTPRGGAAG